MNSTIREALKSGLIGGALGGVISGALNHLVLPFPQTVVDNTIGHGMSGFFCGLGSGFVAVLIHAHRRRLERAAR